MFLAKFEDVVCPSKVLPPVGTYVVHHTTSGPPIASCFRWLDAEKLAAAKAEFPAAGKGQDRPAVRQPLVIASPHGEEGGRDVAALGRFSPPMVTVADSYPLPNMLDFAGEAAGCTIFSQIDLRKSYHQIPVHPADIQKTAITKPFGSFEYLWMPFGLMNAGATFHRKVDRAVADLEAVFAYVDDMDVASRNTEEHAIHLRQLFTRLREHRLVINVEMCVFAASSI